MPVWTEIERSSSPMARRLYRWWIEHRGPVASGGVVSGGVVSGGADIPDRDALHPEDLLPILPNILISELEPDPFRVRYRLVGTRVVTVVGFDFTGRYLDELQPDPITVPWVDYYRTVAETRGPLMGSVTVPAKAGGALHYEFAIFPLRRGGDAVAQFVAVEDYLGSEIASAQWSHNWSRQGWR